MPPMPTNKSNVSAFFDTAGSAMDKAKRAILAANGYTIAIGADGAVDVGQTVKNGKQPRGAV